MKKNLATVVMFMLETDTESRNKHITLYEVDKPASISTVVTDQKVAEKFSQE